MRTTHQLYFKDFFELSPLAPRVILTSEISRFNMMPLYFITVDRSAHFRRTYYRNLMSCYWYFQKISDLITVQLIYHPFFYFCRAKELGFEVMTDLRKKEIEKWGSRVGKA